MVPLPAEAPGVAMDGRSDGVLAHAVGSSVEMSLPEFFSAAAKSST
jgi:hypothetical protein